MDFSCDKVASSEFGIVVGFEGGAAIVDVDENPACSSCGISACSSAGKIERKIKATNPLRAKVGQNVLLTVTPGATATSSLLLFFFPLLILLLAAMILSLIFSPNLSLGIAIILAILYFPIGKITGFFDLFTKRPSHTITMIV